jgi:hypothetical protein
MVASNGLSYTVHCRVCGGSGAQWIDPDALAVLHRGRDVRIAAAPEVGAQDHEALVGRGRKHDVARRRGLRITRRRDEVLAALALVGARGSHVFERFLPGVVHAADDHGIGFRGRDFQHHRSLARVVERVEVDSVRVRGERLVLRVHRARPVDQLVGLGAVGDGGLQHDVEVDGRHAPDHRFHRTPVQRKLGRGLGQNVRRCLGGDRSFRRLVITGRECPEQHEADGQSTSIAHVTPGQENRGNCIGPPNFAPIQRT